MNRIEMLRSIVSQNGAKKIPIAAMKSEESKPALGLRPSELSIALKKEINTINQTTEASGSSSNSGTIPIASPEKSSRTLTPSSKETPNDESLGTTERSTSDEKKTANSQTITSAVPSEGEPRKVTIASLRQEIWQTTLDYKAGKITAKEAAMTARSLRDVMRTIKMELDVLRDFGCLPSEQRKVLYGDGGELGNG